MGASVTMGWAHRRRTHLDLALALLQRGLRPSLVHMLSGLPLECCQELRREVMPEAPPPRAALPRGLDGQAFKARAVREAASLFAAAYLGCAGERAEREVSAFSLIAAFDLHARTCQRIGWRPLPMDYAYSVARFIMEHEHVVTQECAECGGIYVPHAGSTRCPTCLALNPLSGSGRHRRDRPEWQNIEQGRATAPEPDSCGASTRKGAKAPEMDPISA